MQNAASRLEKPGHSNPLSGLQYTFHNGSAFSGTGSGSWFERSIHRGKNGLAFLDGKPLKAGNLGFGSSPAGGSRQPVVWRTTAPDSIVCSGE